MGKPQYLQKFREEWLTEKLFKDWLLKIENDSSKTRCRFCKSEINAKRYDLIQHSNSKKHKEASKAFSTSRSITSFGKVTSIKTSMAEGGLALFIASHCSILSCDHLGELCVKQFSDSEAGKGIKMHGTKCTTVICNILSPHFENNFKTSFADQPYSILIDESTDISVLKFLGVTIMYFGRNIGKIMSTYLSLVEMEACDADAITEAVCKTIEEKGLNIKKMVGLGSDNASVMVGINNGVYKNLKEKVPSLIHIPCVCHSLQLAVSAAASTALPRNIEYLIKETYNWFSHSTLRQAQYKNLCNAINNGHDPLKIVKACDTRWLSIETAVSRILHQWIELKTLFQIARQKEKCYNAEILFNMYSDNNNLAYLTYLHPVLLEIQVVNKSFESNNVDSSKLLNDLTNLVYSIAKRIVNPYCKENFLTCNMDSYTSTNIQWPLEFTSILEKSNSSEDETKQLKERLVQFLQILLKQLQQRLPKNVAILQKVSMMSVRNSLLLVS